MIRILVVLVVGLGLLLVAAVHHLRVQREVVMGLAELLSKHMAAGQHDEALEVYARGQRLSRLVGRGAAGRGGAISQDLQVAMKDEFDGAERGLEHFADLPPSLPR